MGYFNTQEVVVSCLMVHPGSEQIQEKSASYSKVVPLSVVCKIGRLCAPHLWWNFADSKKERSFVFVVPFDFTWFSDSHRRMYLVFIPRV